MDRFHKQVRGLALQTESRVVHIKLSVLIKAGEHQHPVFNPDILEHSHRVLVHSGKVLVKMTGWVGSAKADPAQPRLLIRRVAVIYTGRAAVSILKGVIHPHIVAPHIPFDDKPFFTRGGKGLLHSGLQLAGLMTHGHPKPTVAVHRLYHDGELDFRYVRRIQALVQIILRDAMHTIAFAGYLKGILIGEHINNILCRVTGQVERAAHLAVDGHKDIRYPDQHSVHLFVVSQGN